MSEAAKEETVIKEETPVIKEEALKEEPPQQLSADQLQEIQNLLLGRSLINGDVPAVTATNKTFQEWGTFECDLASKNREIYCPRCPSKICLAETAQLVSKEMKMSKYKVDAPEEEIVERFWQLGSLMAFENIGVTKLVENIKFLSCADCEVGPLGWHDITDNSKFYVAAERVRYLG